MVNIICVLDLLLLFILWRAVGDLWPNLEIVGKNLKFIADGGIVHRFSEKILNMRKRHSSCRIFYFQNRSGESLEFGSSLAGFSTLAGF